MTAQDPYQFYGFYSASDGSNAIESLGYILANRESYLEASAAADTTQQNIRDQETRLADLLGGNAAVQAARASADSA